MFIRHKSRNYCMKIADVFHQRNGCIRYDSQTELFVRANVMIGMIDTRTAKYLRSPDNRVTCGQDSAGRLLRVPSLSRLSSRRQRHDVLLFKGL